MSLFDFVQQHGAVVLAADALRQLPALIVADIARGGANEPGYGVALLEFRHIQPDHIVFVAEHKLGQGAHQFGFANAGGTQEQEHTDGAAGVF